MSREEDAAEDLDTYNNVALSANIVDTANYCRLTTTGCNSLDAIEVDKEKTDAIFKTALRQKLRGTML